MGGGVCLPADSHATSVNNRTADLLTSIRYMVLGSDVTFSLSSWFMILFMTFLVTSAALS